MNLLDIKKVPVDPRSRKKKKRVGRGPASGKGKTCGRGTKGQNSRSGAKRPIVFEGGTMPLYRRLPKRGFSNAKFRDEWISINIYKLNVFKEGEEVNKETLKKYNIVKIPKSKDVKIKILGEGELKVSNLKIKVHKVTESARKKIEEKGGTIELIVKPKKVKKEKSQKK